MMDGLLVVDKPSGFTSHDVVAKLRKIYGQRRVGHAGTLDPDATGVLLVGLGRVTRLLRFLQVAGKEYRADVRFGVATSTLDAAGEVLDRQEMPLGREQVEQAAKRFVGDIEQVPPMVSAIKVGGRRLHDLARRGEEVERAPRPVRIDRLEVEAFEPGPYPMATLFVACGSGTYVRTLAADIGERLGCGAHLAALRRTGIGRLDVASASTHAELEMLSAPVRDARRRDQHAVFFERQTADAPPVRTAFQYALEALVRARHIVARRRGGFGHDERGSQGERKPHHRGQST